MIVENYRNAGARSLPGPHPGCPSGDPAPLAVLTWRRSLLRSVEASDSQASLTAVHCGKPKNRPKAKEPKRQTIEEPGRYPHLIRDARFGDLAPVAVLTLWLRHYRSAVEAVPDRDVTLTQSRSRALPRFLREGNRRQRGSLLEA